MAEGVIGSVGVAVTPDARGFWRDFEAQTRAGAAEAGRHARAEFDRAFNTGPAPTIRPRVDTVRARTELAALNREQPTGLLASLLPLAPAIVPLAGAAALAGAALVSMGATGLTAVKGVQAEMKAGTAEGLKFAAGVNVIKSDFAELAQTSAHGVLTPFQATITKLHAAVPQLNSDLAQSSQVLGDIGGHLATGLIAGEHSFSGALLSAEVSVDKLSARFEAWATGPGGTAFAHALATDFQQVGPVLENVFGAVGHTLGVFNSAGLGVLSTVNTIASVLNSDLGGSGLAVLLTGILDLKAVSTISGLFDKFAVSVRGAAVAEGEAATVSTRLRGGLASGVGLIGKVAAGWIGVSLAAGTAAHATDGWINSSSKGRQYIGLFSKSLSDLSGFHLGAVKSDLFGSTAAQARTAGEFTRQLNSQLAFQAKHLGDVQAQSLKYAGTNKIVVGGQGQLSAALRISTGLLGGQAKQVTIGQQIATSYDKYAKSAKYAVQVQRSLLSVQAASGAPVSQLASVYTNTTKALQSQVDTTNKFLDLGGEKTKDTYKGITVGANTYAAALRQTNGDTAAATGLVHAAIDALLLQRTALAATSAEQARVGKFVSDVGTKYHLTAQQVDLYSEALGINVDKLGKSAAYEQAAEQAVARFSGAIANGNTSIQGWVTAVGTFAASNKTAADRAQLLAAAMISLQGPTLAYASAGAAAASANQQFVTDFRAANKGVVNLRKGFIDFHNAGAGPLLSDLQNLQTQAAGFAAATYQNEVATKGRTQAAKDAASVFKNDTRGALIAEAAQLGITKGEAKKLADTYFHWPKSATTQIEALGGATTKDLLNAIGEQLSILTKTPWKFTVDAVITPRATHAAGLLQSSGRDTARYTTMADGGFITAGTGPRADDVMIRVSKGEAVIPADQAAKHRGLLTNIISRAPGYESGGFVGVTIPKKKTTSTSKSKTKSSSSAASNPFDSSALTTFLQQIGISTSAFTQAKNGLIAALRDQKVSSTRLATVTGIANRLIVDAQRIASETARISKAQTYLSNLRQQSSQERSTVASSFSGLLDLSQAGVSPYTDRPGVSGTSILQSITAAASQGKATAGDLARLKGKIPNSLYQQLAENVGTDQAQIHALAGSSAATLASVGKQYNSLQATGGTAGTAVAGQLFGSKISTAEALLNGYDPRRNPAMAKAVAALSTALFGAGKESAKGLQAGLLSEQKNLEGALHSLAATLERTIKADLHIKSPSRKMHALGAYAAQGFVNGVNEGVPAVRAAISGLTREAVVGGRPGGGLPQIIVNPAPSMDEAALATAVGRRLQMHMVG